MTRNHQAVLRSQTTEDTSRSYRMLACRCASIVSETVVHTVDLCHVLVHVTATLSAHVEQWIDNESVCQ